MYIDLHTHTLLSDGNYSESELIQMAMNNNISSLAMTDHNRIHVDIKQLQEKFPSIELISGSEISAEYMTSNGERREIHIVGLFLKQTEELKNFLAQNCDDGKARTNKILKKLKGQGVDLGCDSWEKFHDMYFYEREFIGRPQIAAIIAEKGYATSVDDAMDKYIGDYGKKIAFVENTFEFSDIKRVIEMVHRVGGCCVLAHPLSYKLPEYEVIKLIRDFKMAGGDAMEVFYGHYSKEDSERLGKLAEQYMLLKSCGSDFHGKREGDRLDHNFDEKYLDGLRKRHMKYKKV